MTSGDDKAAVHEWRPAETEVAERMVRHFLNVAGTACRDTRRTVGRLSVSEDDGRRRLMRLPVTAAGTD